MKPLRSWTQVGLLLAISTWAALNPARSDEPSLPAEPDRSAVVSPDVVAEGDSTPAVVSAPTPAVEALSPEVETSLPTTNATPPTGESSVPKLQKPMDLDSQFEPPIEVNPQPANATPRALFANPATTKVEQKTAEPLVPQPAAVLAPVIAKTSGAATQNVQVGPDVSYSPSSVTINAGDTISEDAGQGTDRVESSISYSLGGGVQSAIHEAFTLG